MKNITVHRNQFFSIPAFDSIENNNQPKIITDQMKQPHNFAP
jgi:hypothetical protein